jgi:hypothetical protein
MNQATDTAIELVAGEVIPRLNPDGTYALVDTTDGSILSTPQPITSLEHAKQWIHDFYLCCMVGYPEGMNPYPTLPRA